MNRAKLLDNLRKKTETYFYTTELHADGERVHFHVIALWREKDKRKKMFKKWQLVKWSKKYCGSVNGLDIKEIKIKKELNKAIDYPMKELKELYAAINYPVKDVKENKKLQSRFKLWGKHGINDMVVIEYQEVNKQQILDYVNLYSSVKDGSRIKCRNHEKLLYLYGSKKHRSKTVKNIDSIEF